MQSGSWYQPARTSTQSGPQIFSNAALNSRSGRTLAGTSMITEKSRGISSRSRTCDSPGLARNSSRKAAGLSATPLRPSHTRMDISAGRFTRAVSSGWMSCTEILGGAFSSGSTKPRTSTGSPRVENGTLGTVMSTGEENRLTIETKGAHEREVQLRTDEFKDLRLAYAQHVYKAQGATVQHAFVL